MMKLTHLYYNHQPLKLAIWSSIGATYKESVVDLFDRQLFDVTTSAVVDLKYDRSGLSFSQQLLTVS